MTKLNEVYDGKKIFEEFKNNFSEKYDALFGVYSSDALDSFILVDYGEKYISPFYNKLEINKIVSFIIFKYYDNWLKILNAINQQYDFTNLYSRTTETTIDKSNDTTTTNTETENNYIYGFDNATATPDNKADATNETTNNFVANEKQVTKIIGNNGNTPYSDLLIKEIQARFNCFISIVINDIINQITLSIY